MWSSFYTSGRTSNEAAFLYQIFVREYGTNNFPDCSNMCHEATSVGLPVSIGVGKGTVTLEDFDLCDAIFCIGHNPGTNHPRIADHPARGVEARRADRGVQPLRERGLERFAAPQSPLEMLTLGSTPIASASTRSRSAAMSRCSRHDEGRAGRRCRGRRRRRRTACSTGPFIASHTTGFEALVADLRAACPAE